MSKVLRDRLDKALQTCIEMHTRTCHCCGLGHRGCRSCGWTGIYIPPALSPMVTSETLGSCIMAMSEAQRLGDRESLKVVLDWAKNYIAPLVQGVDPQEASEMVKNLAAHGRALVSEASQGPTEPLSLDELKRRTSHTKDES